MYNLFLSVSQSPIKENENIDDEVLNQLDENAITYVEGTESKTTKATDQLKENSAPRPDGIPPTFLRRPTMVRAKPMILLLRQSVDESSIAEVHEMAYVLPIPRGRSKLLPKQYRSVSLKSYVIKAFERVIREKLKHLSNYNYRNEG